MVIPLHKSKISLIKGDEMPLQGTRYSLIFLLVIGTILLPCFSLADEDPHATGLRPPSPEQVLWEKAHMILPQRIRLNERGLSRLNDHFDAIGQPRVTFSAMEITNVGDEIEGTTAEKSGGAPMHFSPLEQTTSFPSAVDNSTLKYFPPIRSQGSLGSCAQWAGMYYCFTHMNAMARDLDAKNGPETNRFSPKFTYNLVNYGVDAGSWQTDGWAIAAKHGAANLADWPYDGDYRGWPLAASVWRNALNVRVNTTGLVTNCDTPTGMDQLKTLLLNGYVLTFATYVNSWQFKKIGNDLSTGEDDAFVGKDVGYWVNGTSGPHAMTVVGYNDTVWIDINGNGIVNTGEKGAFRIANSWGSGWRDGGFTWLAYDALKSVSAVTGAPSSGRIPAWWFNNAMWVTAKPAWNPTALAQFTLNHARRNELKIFLGQSDTTQSTPTTLFTPSYMLQNAGGAYAFNGGTSAVDGTFVMDFSDIASVYDLSKRWYLRVLDSPGGSAAQVKSFKWINGADNTEVANTSLPATVNGSGVDFSLDATMTHGSGNTPPAITTLSDLSTNEDTPTGSRAFTVGDAETPLASLAVSGGSSNGTLLPNSNIVISGTGASRSVVLTPAPDQTGSTVITLTVTDGGGLIAQTLYTLTVNPVNDAPVALAQNLGVLFNTPKSLTLNATDVEGDALTYSPSAPSHGSISGTPPQLIYTPTTGFAGTDSFTFTADDGPLTSVPATVTLTIDTTPPAVAITRPTAGQTLSGVYQILANASDNLAVDRVVFFVDGAAKSTDSVSTYTYDWNTLGVANGAHALSARAYDNAGNQTISAVVNITVSNTAVAAVTVTPTALSFYSIQGGTVPPVGLLSIGAVEGAPALGWTVTVSTTWLSASPPSGTGEDIVSIGVDPAELPIGVYTATATVTPFNLFQNSASPLPVRVPISLTISEASDIIPPTVPAGLTAVANGSNEILLTWGGSTDSGGSGLANYRLFRNNTVRAQPAQTQFTDTGVTVGVPYEYAVAAVDNAGNQSGLSNLVEITVSTETMPAKLIETYSYPEPALRGAAPVIRVVMGNVEGVEITIYDSGGTPRQSARLDSPNAIVDGKAAYEYTWTGDIPSGVYYAVVHGRAGNETIKAKTRITVVR